MIRRPAADEVRSPECEEIFAAVALPPAPVSLSEGGSVAPPGWQLRLLASPGWRLPSMWPPLLLEACCGNSSPGTRNLHDGSDLDLVWPIKSALQGQALAWTFRYIDAAGDVPIDGQFVLPDDGGVNWREFASGAIHVMLKTAYAGELRSRVDRFQR